MYKIANSIGLQKFIVKDNNIWIPVDEANTDYQAYLEWLNEGNTPEPAEE